MLWNIVGEKLGIPNASIAQLIVQSISNRQVIGLTPIGST